MVRVREITTRAMSSMGMLPIKTCSSSTKASTSAGTPEQRRGPCVDRGAQGALRETLRRLGVALRTLNSLSWLASTPLHVAFHG